MLFNKVTIKGAKQAVQMFGPAQAAVARAVVDSVSEGVISKAQANDLCILVGVFIHWQAEDDKKIYQFNYQATKESIARALQGKPTVDEVLSEVQGRAASVRQRRRRLIATVPTVPSSGEGRPAFGRAPRSFHGPSRQEEQPGNA